MLLACPAQLVHGFTVDGTFAEYTVAWTYYVTPLPESLDSAAATSILCAVSTSGVRLAWRTEPSAFQGLSVYKGLKRINVPIGSWIAIAGAGGGLGHLGESNIILRLLPSCSRQTPCDTRPFSNTIRRHDGFPRHCHRHVSFSCSPPVGRTRSHPSVDSGEEKRKLCLLLGAEKWIDFRESGDALVEDVIAAADGLGPKAALITTGTVSLFCPTPFMSIVARTD
ncbi:hypothetical protein J3R82DRAFT_5111 [Butyriboletus roseoflavus]|nr:hypothetical protein J3R82DRAFT_5111 [Butyriboletus roseoflavus]